MCAVSNSDPREAVRERYGEIARSGSSCCSGGGCSTKNADKLATQLGYDAEQLAALPPDANLGLSCGNPTALGELKAGETVLDLGCGGGLDCFVAGPLVGAAGRAIGVDMTPDMLVRARRNVAAYRERSGMDNVEFRLGEIEHLPVADASVNVVISNCVINLSADKQQVWHEIARVLKPGGRVAVSDMALKQALPPAIRESVEALVGCIAGASMIDDIRSMVAAAGLVDVEIQEKSRNLQSMVDASESMYREVHAALPAGSTVDDYVVSVNVVARKVLKTTCCAR